MKQRNYYKIIVLSLVGIFFTVMTWNGMPATLDKIAALRMPIPMEVATCMAEFNEQMQGLKLQ